MSEQVGISGFAVYVPPYRVDLASWCAWTGAEWDKMRAVVGHSFRMRGPTQNVYTMAAAAVMRLIEQYDIDPARIGFLGLGTESSTDNAAGAVIVKGMVDEGLKQQGRAPVSRHCEVPEVKHACLGGVYSLKNALRYLALEPQDRCAIVVSADIAQYARGSSGEPTQGAGAVAMLLERQPGMLAVSLPHIGSASAYRALDFRKPILRNLESAQHNNHYLDIPVFNGKYSTTCYLDESLQALNDMSRRLGMGVAEYYREVSAVFMHRPYHRMPESSLAMSYLFGLMDDGTEGRDELARHCAQAGVPLDEVLTEMQSTPDVLDLVKQCDIDADTHPLCIELSRQFRKSDVFHTLIASRMSLGSEVMKDIGNVYCAALPAWMAAGMEDAAARGLDLAGKKVLAVGYGSGDAAEAMPMTVMDGWAEAASRIDFRAALEPWQALTQTQYEALHDRGTAAGLEPPPNGFIIESIGTNAVPEVNDDGVEYYRYLS